MNLSAYSESVMQSSFSETHAGAYLQFPAYERHVGADVGEQHLEVVDVGVELVAPLDLLRYLHLEDGDAGVPLLAILPLEVLQVSHTGRHQCDEPRDYRLEELAPLCGFGGHWTTLCNK